MAGAPVHARRRDSRRPARASRRAHASRDAFEFRGETSFRSWLHAHICNKLRSRRRFYLAQKRYVRLEAVQPRLSTDSDLRLVDCRATFRTPIRNARHREEVERIEVVLDRLSEDHRTVIILAQLLGLPHAEIAHRMGRSDGATRVLLHRAPARLAALPDDATESGTP